MNLPPKYSTQMGNMKNDLAEMEEQEGFRYKPIGHVKSVFQGMTSLLLSPKKICFMKYFDAGKSGTPRQSGLSKHARARLMSALAQLNDAFVAPLPIRP